MSTSPQSTISSTPNSSSVSSSAASSASSDSEPALLKTPDRIQPISKMTFHNSPAFDNTFNNKKTTFAEDDFNPAEEFDFAKNNQLFNKRHFYTHVDSAADSDRPDSKDIAREQSHRSKMYKHTENVLNNTKSPRKNELLRQKSSSTFNAVSAEKFKNILTKLDSIGISTASQAQLFGNNVTNWISTCDEILRYAGTTRAVNKKLKFDQIRKTKIMALIGNGRKGLLAMSIIKHLARKFNFLSIILYTLQKSQPTDNPITVDILKEQDLLKQHYPSIQFVTRINNLIETSQLSGEQNVSLCIDGVGLENVKYAEKQWCTKIKNWLTTHQLPMAYIDLYGMGDQLRTTHMNNIPPAKYLLYSTLPIERDTQDEASTQPKVIIFDSGSPTEIVFQPAISPLSPFFQGGYINLEGTGPFTHRA